MTAPESDKPSASSLPPLVSTTAAISLGLYAYFYGVTSLSPPYALMLLAAMSVVIAHAVDQVRSRFDNGLTRALLGLLLMMGMVAGLPGVALLILRRVEKHPDLVDALLQSKSVEDALSNVGQVVLIAPLAVVIWLVLFVVFLLVVYLDMLGPRRYDTTPDR